MKQVARSVFNNTTGPRRLLCRGAFTIVEMTVVLIIIGLVAGAVVVGRELMIAWQIRSLARQLGDYDSAVMSFRAKYGGLPGDLTDASDFGLAESGCPAVSPCDINGTITDAGCNGNGNNLLDDGDDPPSMTYMHCPENLSFWYHLSISKMIAGTFDGKTTSNGVNTLRTPVYGVSAPTTSLRDIGIVTKGTLLLVGHNDTGSSVNQYQLLNSEAQGLDSKLDDGLPLAGTVRAWGLSFTMGCYGPPLPMHYRLDNAAGRCILSRSIAGFGQ